MGSGINLTLEQKALILGSVLGDGHIEKRWANPRLRIDHSTVQKDYVWWKYNILQNIATNEPRLTSQKDLRSGKIHAHCYFSTRAMPELNWYYNLFYVDGRKVIQRELLKHFNQPLSLAIWLMDDGYKRNDCEALRLSTDYFSLEEQKILQECLDKNFGINSKIHKKGKAWNLYIPSLAMTRARNMLMPLLTLTMQYKLPPRNDLIRKNRIAV